MAAIQRRTFLMLNLGGLNSKMLSYLLKIIFLNIHLRKHTGFLLRNALQFQLY